MVKFIWVKIESSWVSDVPSLSIPPWKMSSRNRANVQGFGATFKLVQTSLSHHSAHFAHVPGCNLVLCCGILALAWRLRLESVQASAMRLLGPHGYGEKLHQHVGKLRSSRERESALGLYCLGLRKDHALFQNHQSTSQAFVSLHWASLPED